MNSEHCHEAAVVREVSGSQQEPDQLLQRFGKVRSALSEGLSLMANCLLMQLFGLMGV
jgi:hypothetical protein